MGFIRALHRSRCGKRGYATDRLPTAVWSLHVLHYRGQRDPEALSDRVCSRWFRRFLHGRHGLPSWKVPGRKLYCDQM